MISNWLLIMIFFRFGFCSPPPHKNGGGGCTGAHGSLPFFLKSYFARDVFLEIFFRVILQAIQNFSSPGISKVSSGALCCCCNIENFQVLGGVWKAVSFFWKFGSLCLLETPVLRFDLLPYYRRIMLWNHIKYKILEKLILRIYKTKTPSW